MPKVPTYSQPAVSQEGLPGVRFSSSASAASFGGNEAKNIQTIGEAVTTIGSGVLKAQMREDEINRKLTARDKITQAQAEVNSFLQNDIYSRKGENILTAEADAKTKIEEIRQKYTKDLKDDETRLMFNSSFDPHYVTSMETVGGFQRKGKDEYTLATINAENQTAIDSAILNRSNPNAIAEAELTVTANTANRYAGLDPKIRQQNVMLAVNDLHSRIAEKANEENPEAALEYVKTNWDKFDPSSRQKLKDGITAKVELQVVDTQAQRIASLPPMAQEKEIEKIKNPDIQKKVRSGVKEVISFKESTRVLAEKAWYEPQFDALAKDPYSYQVPTNAPADKQEHLIELKKKYINDDMAKKGAGKKSETNWVYYNKLMQMPEEEFMKQDITSPEARANLNSAEIKQLIGLQRDGGSNLMQAQSYNSYVNSLVKSTGNEKDFEKSNFIRAMFDAEINKLPPDERKKSDSWNKVAKTLTMDMDIQGAFFNKPYWETKRKGLKDYGPAKKPDAVPGQAVWVDKTVEGQIYRGWEETTPSGRKKLHAPDGSRQWWVD